MPGYPAPPPFDPSGSSASKPTEDAAAPAGDTAPAKPSSSGGGGYPAPPPFDATKPNKPSSSGSGMNTNDGPATIGGDNMASFKMEFDKIDANGSGSIDPQEIEKLFLGAVPASLIKKAVSYVDSNKDGKIDFGEYAAIRKKLSALKSKK